MPAMLRLEAFGGRVFDAYGLHPYLVGSAANGKFWRDVDVRLILPDERFDALFPDHCKPARLDRLWGLLCDALSTLGQQQTGLPVDFQFQRETAANNRYGGRRRVPLGLRLTD